MSKVEGLEFLLNLLGKKQQSDYPDRKDNDNLLTTRLVRKILAGNIVILNSEEMSVEPDLPLTGNGGELRFIVRQKLLIPQINDELILYYIALGNMYAMQTIKSNVAKGIYQYLKGRNSMPHWDHNIVPSSISFGSRKNKIK